MALVFVPVHSAERSAVAAGRPLEARRAHMVTPELMAALEYGPEAVEDAEYAAMVLASITGLAQYGERIVLVAEVEDSSVHAGEDADNGEVLVDDVPAARVQSFFADADPADASAAASAAHGLSIDAAWELPAVQQLLASTDLLWHGAEELGTPLGS